MSSTKCGADNARDNEIEKNPPYPPFIKGGNRT